MRGIRGRQVLSSASDRAISNFCLLIYLFELNLLRARHSTQHQVIETYLMGLFSAVSPLALSRMVSRATYGKHTA
jgi:hypothetical protein